MDRRTKYCNEGQSEEISFQLIEYRLYVPMTLRCNESMYGRVVKGKCGILKYSTKLRLMIHTTQYLRPSHSTKRAVAIYNLSRHMLHELYVVHVLTMAEHSS